MKQIELKIAGKIWVKKSDCDRELRTLFRKNFSFKSNKTFNGNLEFRTIYSSQEVGNETYYTFPANFDYFKEKIIDKTSGEIDWVVVDERVAPVVDGFVSNVVPREHQIPILEDMEKFGYNALVTASTGSGKTALCLYLAEKLQTPMLFIASRVNLINNFSLIECAKFRIDMNQVTEINSQWLDNPKITPIMVTSIQALSEEILAELYDKVGIVVMDEVHLGSTAEEYNNRLTSMNAKYRLYLSATPYNPDYSEEFTKAILSSNIVSAPERIDFKIDLVTFNTIVPSHIHTKYNSVYTAHEKRQILYTQNYVRKVCELAYYLTRYKGRGVLLYNEDAATQEMTSHILKMYGLKVGTLNSNTSAKDKKYFLSNFDNGGIDILVSGGSISAGVSLERLSVIIDTSIKINKNNLQQLVGRLKRKNNEVCDKSKLFIKVTSQGLSGRKWKDDIQALKEFDYINFHKTLSAEHYAEYSLLGLGKNFIGELSKN